MQSGGYAGRARPGAGREEAGAPAVSQQPGVIVLAAYHPAPELFRRQLWSIQKQTRGDFTCLVGADGNADAVRLLVAEAVKDDPRFVVLGWEEHVGFYFNFERLLRAVPRGAGWVALSDQDDDWYPDKLERLVPLLDDFTLAAGQARVVNLCDGEVLGETRRRVVPATDLLLQNHVSGALCAFRRELLDVALPFPQLSTVTQAHDHWLAMCAVATGRYAVLDETVQDYVQHHGNLIGEGSQRPGTAVLAWRKIRELADDYEGGSSALQRLRACHTLSFGWRRAMLMALESRLSSVSPEVTQMLKDLGPGASRRRVLRVLLIAMVSGRSARGTIATFLPGLPVELAKGSRRRQLGGMTHAAGQG